MGKEGNNIILEKISDAKRLTEELAQVSPDEAPWPTLLALLKAHEDQVRDHWPLTAEEKEGCILGWFSVKNIEEVFPQLDAALTEIAYALRHSGG